MFRLFFFLLRTSWRHPLILAFNAVVWRIWLFCFYSLNVDSAVSSPVSHWELPSKATVLPVGRRRDDMILLRYDRIVTLEFQFDL